MTPSRERTVGAGIAVMVVAAVCISLSNILSPLVYSTGTTVTALLLGRFLVFPCLCFAWLRLQQTPLSMTSAERVTAFGAGLFYMTGHGCLIGSFSLIPVSLAILLLFTFPLITLLGEAILDRRLPGLISLGCILTAFFGLTIALQVEWERLSWPGIALALTAAICVSTAFLWTGRKLSHIDSTLMTFHMALSGLALAAVYAVMSGTFTLVLPAMADVVTFLAAVLTFNAAFLAMYVGVRRIGASQAAMFMNMEPVFTIALAVMVLSERLSVWQACGAALVIAAVIAAQLAGPQSPAAPTYADR